MKTAAVYARVSTRDKEQNPDTHLLALREHAARRSYTIVEEYVDNGFSGSKTCRPALDRLMKDARRGRFDAAIVWRFDRFGRSVKQLVLALEEFRALDVGFISLSESIDTTTPMGKMIFAVTAALSEFLLDITRENVCAGLDRARKEGKLPCITRVTAAHSSAVFVQLRASTKVDGWVLIQILQVPDFVLRGGSF